MHNNNRNNLNAANAINGVLNTIMALLEFIVLGYVFCTIIAPIFLATSLGSQMWESVKDIWVNRIYSSVLADPEALINHLVIKVVGLIKSLIKPEFHEYFALGLTLWLVFESIGFALGFRRFRYTRFFRPEDFRPIFDEPMRTTRTRMANRSREQNDDHDRVIYQEDNNHPNGRHLRHD